MSCSLQLRRKTLREIVFISDSPYILVVCQASDNIKTQSMMLPIKSSNYVGISKWICFVIFSSGELVSTSGFNAYSTSSLVTYMYTYICRARLSATRLTQRTLCKLLYIHIRFISQRTDKENKFVDNHYPTVTAYHNAFVLSTVINHQNSCLTSSHRRRLFNKEDADMMISAFTDTRASIPSMSDQPTVCCTRSTRWCGESGKDTQSLSVLFKDLDQEVRAAQNRAISLAASKKENSFLDLQ